MITKDAVDYRLINSIICSRRQHSNGATWSGISTKSSRMSDICNKTSSEGLRGASHDLFELLERVQSSRLDDQRCVLPSYFSNKVSRNSN